MHQGVNYPLIHFQKVNYAKFLFFLLIFQAMQVLLHFNIAYKTSAAERFLEKFYGNSFALKEAEDNTSGPLNRGAQQIYLC